MTVARTAGFALLYVVATYAGRLTVMDSTNLSLVDLTELAQDVASGRCDHARSTGAPVPRFEIGPLGAVDAICKRIVERHGGVIAAGENPDHTGTRITFTLPA
jgi:hypothetical protein